MKRKALKEPFPSTFDIVLWVGGSAVVGAAVACVIIFAIIQ